MAKKKTTKQSLDDLKKSVENFEDEENQTIPFGVVLLKYTLDPLPGPKANGMTKVNVDNEVLDMMIIDLLYVKLWSTLAVQQWIMDEFSIQRKRTQEIIKRAKDKMTIVNDLRRESILNDCLNIFEANRQKAAQIDDLKEVRENTKELAKLFNLYITNVSVEHKIEQPLFLPPIIDIDIIDDEEE